MAKVRCFEGNVRRKSAFYKRGRTWNLGKGKNIYFASEFYRIASVLFKVGTYERSKLGKSSADFPFGFAVFTSE